jgi:structural maintenance of chromosome 3 (chondroitin sulfate proteoglycan 6)
MADLIRTRTEIECVIADFKASQVGGEERRQGMSEELVKLEERIEEANNRLEHLEDGLRSAIEEEQTAKKTYVNGLGLQLRLMGPDSITHNPS